uniref:Uncharacterized protein n=1 Tax=Ditylenchus dipsaci TaxID=166011 RepID=A0A915DCC5_9BILA
MDEYTSVITKATAAERANETATFETFLTEQGIEAALERASDFMTKLQDKLTGWRIEIKKRHSKLEVKAVSQHMTTPASSVHLPSLLLNKFKDDKHWNTTKFVATLSNLLEKEEALQGICSLSFSEKKIIKSKSGGKKKKVKHTALRKKKRTNPKSKQQQSGVTTDKFQLGKHHTRLDFQPPPQGSYFTSLPSQRSPLARANTENTRLFPCWMCNGSHWPSDCDQYTTGEQRKAKLYSSTDVLTVADQATPPETVVFEEDMLLLQANPQSPVLHEPGWTTGQWTTANPENPDLRGPAYLAFDTMSHKTFIAEEVKEKLKLKNGLKDEFKLWGINDKGRGPTLYSTNKVKIHIQRKDKGYITITPTVMKECVPTPTRMALLTSESLEALNKETLLLPVCTKKPDLLIGWTNTICSRSRFCEDFQAGLCYWTQQLDISYVEKDNFNASPTP